MELAIRERVFPSDWENTVFTIITCEC